MDYCCYGAVLARVLLGKPQSVSAMGGRLVKQEIDVDDNAILIMRYPQAMAVSEGSWTQQGSLTAYSTVIYGTEGTLMLEPRHGGRLLLATADCPAGAEVTLPEQPPELRTATDHFVASINNSTPFCALCHDENGCDTQIILDAGARSLDSGAVVTL